jgi:hypothetical protein
MGTGRALGGAASSPPPASRPLPPAQPRPWAQLAVRERSGVAGKQSQGRGVLPLTSPSQPQPAPPRALVHRATRTLHIALPGADSHRLQYCIKGTCGSPRVVTTTQRWPAGGFSSLLSPPQASGVHPKPHSRPGPSGLHPSVPSVPWATCYPHSLCPTAVSLCTCVPHLSLLCTLAHILTHWHT